MCLFVCCFKAVIIVTVFSTKYAQSSQVEFIEHEFHLFQSYLMLSCRHIFVSISHALNTGRALKFEVFHRVRFFIWLLLE